MDMLATYCRAWVHVQAIESQLNGVYTVDGAKGNTVRSPVGRQNLIGAALS